MDPKRTTVGVIFGGRSGEHEVSVISGHQVMAALQVAGFSILPIYITKEGHWFAGTALNDLAAYKRAGFSPESLEGAFRVSLSPDTSVRELVLHPQAKTKLFQKRPKLWADVFFPVMHGSFGEDGTLQGLLELAGVPFVGPSALAAALTMDKVRTKLVCRQCGVPVLDCRSFSRLRWQMEREAVLREVEEFHAYPLIVKPMSLGSSIGVKRCSDRASLEFALDAALVLDEQVMVEEALTDFIEINCSVMGPPVRASVCEQPCSESGVLTFDEKYKRGGGGKKQGGTKTAETKDGGMAALQRIIPAPIPEELTKRVQELAMRAFEATRCSGVSRIDFLYHQPSGSLYFNELNSIPGSLSFYLWEPAGLRFDELVTKCVEIAVRRSKDREDTLYSFEANLLRS